MVSATGHEHAAAKAKKQPRNFHVSPVSLEVPLARRSDSPNRSASNPSLNEPPAKFSRGWITRTQRPRYSSGTTPLWGKVLLTVTKLEAVAKSPLGIVLVLVL